MNQAIQSVDLLAWLTGPIVSVTAHTTPLAHREIAVEDVAVTKLKFSSRALGTFEATTAAYPGYLKKIELYGSFSLAVSEEENIKIWDLATTTNADALVKRRMIGKTRTDSGAGDPVVGIHGHTEQFKDVIKAIKTGAKPLPRRHGRPSQRRDHSDCLQSGGIWENRDASTQK